MQDSSIEVWEHSHNFLSATQARAERNTRRVIVLTAGMMVAEIAAGSVFGSMALLADGWHMASHTSALGLAAFAYAYARTHAQDARYAFGTWKVGVLGGFTSAVVLAVIAALILWESLGRLHQPLPINFDDAIIVAALGLVVNLVSAYVLGDHRPPIGKRENRAETPRHHHDHNLRAAYFHVLADALTSVLAIAALLAGKYFGWVRMDPLMGVVGSVIIGRWSYGLLRDTSKVLLDGGVDPGIARRLRQMIEEQDDDRVADLHLWQVGPHHLSAIISVVTRTPRPPEHYKRLLNQMNELTHVTVEVNCRQDER